MFLNVLYSSSKMDCRANRQAICTRQWSIFNLMCKVLVTMYITTGGNVIIYVQHAGNNVCTVIPVAMCNDWCATTRLLEPNSTAPIASSPDTDRSCLVRNCSLDWLDGPFRFLEYLICYMCIIYYVFLVTFDR